MKNCLFLLSIFSFAFYSCHSPGEQTHAPEKEQSTPKAKKLRPSAFDNGKFFEKDGVKYLYGGEDNKQHFNITDYTLKDEQFHYGIGREAFPALLEPRFISVKEAMSLHADTARFLLAYSGNDVKAYSVKDLIRHEVVNDVLDGKPVFAAYCILADLGAMYDRTYQNKSFTFALSGYTYYDKDVWDGMDGFVMWDRETESLWWPLIGEAVSGPMKGKKMKVMDEANWMQTDWKHIYDNYPQALVLESGQDFERPKEWVKYDVSNEDEGDHNASVAPKWKK